MSDDYGCKALLQALEDLRNDPLPLDQSKITTIEVEVGEIKVKITVG